MNPYDGPLLTLPVHQALLAAREAGRATLDCSLDLGRGSTTVEPGPADWGWNGRRYPYAGVCKERTIYWWDGAGFAAVSRFGSGLIKLVPTDWGPPTFEIDGIKMLPTAQASPWADAQRKIGLVEPRGKIVLDCCGGLGYFAACCIEAGARQILSFEKNPDVIWLRSLNPYSPRTEAPLSLTQGSILDHIITIADASIDAVLHDPPRFGIAGELYAQTFYDQLARVLRPGGRLFHYTGTPNKLSSGRDLPREVSARLQKSGFRAELNGDGVLAVKEKRTGRR